MSLTFADFEALYRDECGCTPQAARLYAALSVDPRDDAAAAALNAHVQASLAEGICSRCATATRWDGNRQWCDRCGIYWRRGLGGWASGITQSG